jgi:hypothetical protein
MLFFPTTYGRQWHFFIYFKLLVNTVYWHNGMHFYQQSSIYGTTKAIPYVRSKQKIGGKKVLRG